MKQTAVEWLERRYYFTKGQLIDIDFEKAKELEKEQIVDAFDKGIDNGKDNDFYIKTHIGEKYYNENFNK